MRRTEESLLAVLLGVMLICHGMFFRQEWFLLGFLFLAISWRAGVYQEFRPGRAYVLFGTLCCLSLVGGLFTGLWLAAVFEVWRWFLYYTAYLWGCRFREGNSHGAFFLRCLTRGALILLLLSALPVGLPTSDRFGSFFGYPNAAGVLCGWLLLSNQERGLLRAIYAAVCFALLLASGSRGSVYLLLLLGCFRVLSQRRRQARISAGAAIFFTVTLTLAAGYGPNSFFEGGLTNLLHGPWSTVEARLDYYKDCWSFAAAAKFLPQAGGWQYSLFLYESPYWVGDPHSSFFYILLHQGGLGVLLLTIWLGHSVWRLFWEWRKKRERPQKANSALFSVPRASICFLFLHSLFDADLCFGVLGLLFWLLAPTFFSPHIVKTKDGDDICYG